MICSRFETVRPTWVRVTLSKKQDSELAGRDPGSLRPQARKDVHVPTHTNGFPYPSGRTHSRRQVHLVMSMVAPRSIREAACVLSSLEEMRDGSIQVHGCLLFAQQGRSARIQHGIERLG